MNEKLEALREQLRTQNEALDEAKQTLAAMGDVQFQIPSELLEQLDDACMVQASGRVIQEGAIRA